MLTFIRRLGWLSWIVAFGATVLSFLVAYLTWKATADGYTQVVESYIDTPSGRMFGSYCSKDGTILDGGIVCHTLKEVVYYTTFQRIAMSTLAAVVVCGVAVWLMSWLVKRIAK